MAQLEDLENGTHVIKFFAEWCGPCKLYAPAFERVASLNPEAVFHAVNVDEDVEIKDAFGVQSIPTTVIVKNGEEVERAQGPQSTRALDALLKRVLPLKDDNRT